MKIPFVKMHGLGNDFIVIDARGRRLRGLPALMRRLSPRRFGIGFDQALVLRSSKRADFAMDIYNGDGSKVEMCGNGIRCLAAYIWKRGLSRKKILEIDTMAGIIRPERMKGGLVRVDMGAPVFEGREIPVRLEGPVLDHPLKVAGRTFAVTCVSMGNPHCVVFVDDVEKFDIEKYGPALETHGFFPNRANVEFVEVLSRRRLRMRVWERGTGVTLACGTGASASAVAARLKGLTQRSVSVVLDGGRLRIEWSEGENVFMTGPAEEVYTGVVET